MLAGHLCSVQAGGARREQPADPTPVHLPGSGHLHGVVVGLPVYPVCHVQARSGAGISCLHALEVTITAITQGAKTPPPSPHPISHAAF